MNNRIYFHWQTRSIRWVVHIKVYIRMVHTMNPFPKLPRVQGPLVRNPWLEHWVLLQVGRPRGWRVVLREVLMREPRGKEWGKSPETMLHTLHNLSLRSALQPFIQGSTKKLTNVN